MLGFLAESLLTFLMVWLHFFDNILMYWLDLHFFLKLDLAFIVFDLVSFCELWSHFAHLL